MCDRRFEPESERNLGIRKGEGLFFRDPGIEVAEGVRLGEVVLRDQSRIDDRQLVLAGAGPLHVGSVFRGRTFPRLQLTKAGK